MIKAIELDPNNFAEDFLFYLLQLRVILGTIKNQLSFQTRR